MSTATTMQSFVEQFLEERHRLGFTSRTMGHALRSFATHVDAQALTGPLRIEVMASWARCPKNASDDPITWARRLKMLRPFARWFRQFEPDTAVPDSSIFGSVGQRLAPHIYTEQEIADLLAAAHRLLLLSVIREPPATQGRTLPPVIQTLGGTKRAGVGQGFPGAFTGSHGRDVRGTMPGRSDNRRPATVGAVRASGRCNFATLMNTPARSTLANRAG